MKRYFSHYTYIYPDIYLRNYVVELDDNNKIAEVFPFVSEIEKTEFHSGLLIFIPTDKAEVSDEFVNNIKKSDFSDCESVDYLLDDHSSFKIIYKEDF